MDNKKKCKFCQSEISEKAKVCPNCRRLVKFPVGTWIGLTLLILAIAFSFGILFSIDKDDDYNSNYSTSKGGDDFTYQVVNSGADTANFAYYIEGVVTNLSNKEYSYVQIEFICYDSDGNNLGTAMDNTNNVLGKESWKFNAMGLFSGAGNVDHCTFKEISAW